MHFQILPIHSIQSDLLDYLKEPHFDKNSHIILIPDHLENILLHTSNCDSIITYNYSQPLELCNLKIAEHHAKYGMIQKIYFIVVDDVYPKLFIQEGGNQYTHEILRYLSHSGILCFLSLSPKCQEQCLSLTNPLLNHCLEKKLLIADQTDDVLSISFQSQETQETTEEASLEKRILEEALPDLNKDLVENLEQQSASFSLEEVESRLEELEEAQIAALQHHHPISIEYSSLEYPVLNAASNIDSEQDESPLQKIPTFFVAIAPNSPVMFGNDGSNCIYFESINQNTDEMIHVLISVKHGTLFFRDNILGIHILSGNQQESKIVFAGYIDIINEAFNALSYTPKEGLYDQKETLKIQYLDRAHLLQALGKENFTHTDQLIYSADQILSDNFPLLVPVKSKKTPAIKGKESYRFYRLCKEEKLAGSLFAVRKTGMEGASIDCSLDIKGADVRKKFGMKPYEEAIQLFKKTLKNPSEIQLSDNPVESEDFSKNIAIHLHTAFKNKQEKE